MPQPHPCTVARRRWTHLARGLTVLLLVGLLPWGLMPARAQSPFDLRPALDQMSGNMPAVLAAAPDEFNRGWASPDPMVRLSALRTLAVRALFRIEALRLLRPRLDDGLLLAEQQGDKALHGLLHTLKAATDFLANRTAEGSRQKRDDHLARAARLLEQAGDPTARCLGKYLHGNLVKYEVSDARRMEPFLSALTLQDASATCRAWIVAMINTSNGRFITTQDPSKADEAAAETREALAWTPPEKFPALGGRLLIALGTVYHRAGRFAEAEAPLRRAIAVAQGVRDDHLEVGALDALQYVYTGLNRPRDVLALLARDAALSTGETPDDAGLRAIRVAEVNAMLTPPDRGAALAALRQAEQLFAGKTDDKLSRRMAEVRAYVYERVGDHAQALAETKQLYEMSQRRIVENHTRQLAELQVQHEVKVRALESERLQLSVDALTARRNLLGFGLVATVLVLGALALLYRRQVQQKRRLAELYGQLESLNASRSTFLAAACHDLRQPAHSLELLAEVAAGDARPDAAVVQDIRRNSNVLGDMLSSLLDMAQLESAQPQVNLQPVSLDMLFDEATLQFRAQAARKGLAFQRSGQGLWVRSDPQLLRRIVFNLVGNACKYTVRGAVHLEMAPGADGGVQLRVRDTGPGIPKDRIPDMLRPYARLDHGAKEQGLGLGLSVVQRATQALGHALRIDSTVGSGTTVTVELPRVDAPTVVADAPAGAGASGPAGPADAATPAAHPALVAVLEDNDEVRSALLRLLDRWGLRTVEGATSAELLARLAGDGAPVVPDLLLVDHDLGPEDGIEVTRAIRARAGLGGLRAVLVTGSIDTDTERLAHDAGMAVLLKPTRPSVLRRTLDRELAAAREGALHQ